MKDLEKWVTTLDYLDHKYDPAADDIPVAKLIAYLGEYFPVSVLDQVKKHYGEKIREIEGRVIPELLLEDNLTEVKTDNGLVVKLKTEYTEDKDIEEEEVEDDEDLVRPVIAWVIHNGGKDLVTRTFKFQKGDNVERLRAVMEEDGLYAKESVNIHHKTLSKFFADFAEEKGEIPPYCKVYNHAVVTKVGK